MMSDFDIKQVQDLERQIRELRQQVIHLTETVSTAIRLLDERTSLLRSWLRRLTDRSGFSAMSDDDDRPAA